MTNTIIAIGTIQAAVNFVIFCTTVGSVWACEFYVIFQNLQTCAHIVLK